jgi:hypothetical protein
LIPEVLVELNSGELLSDHVRILPVKTRAGPTPTTLPAHCALEGKWHHESCLHATLFESTTQT